MAARDGSEATRPRASCSDAAMSSQATTPKSTATFEYGYESEESGDDFFAQLFLDLAPSDMPDDVAEGTQHHTTEL